MPSDAYGVIGNPIAHSRSPQIHAAFAQQTHQQISYQRLLAEPDAFVQTVKRFIADGGRGLNVTVPFKEQAFALADECSDAARLAGAVNTLSFRGGRISGDNTDGIGLVRDLTVRLGARVSGATLIVLGAGGAARGIVGPLIDAGAARIIVANRTAARAQALVANWRELNTDADPHQLTSCPLTELARTLDQVAQPEHAIWLNSTAASLTTDALPLPPLLLGQAAMAYDLVYAARPTPFMKQASQAGCRSVADGLGMLVEQAAESFYIWRGQRPVTGAVYDELRQQLN